MHEYLIVEVNAQGDRTPKLITDDIDSFLENDCHFNFGMELYPISNDSSYLRLTQAPIFSSLKKNIFKGRKLKQAIMDALDDFEGELVYSCTPCGDEPHIFHLREEMDCFLFDYYEDDFATNSFDFGNFLSNNYSIADIFEMDDCDKDKIYCIFKEQKLNKFYKEIVEKKRVKED